MTTYNVGDIIHYRAFGGEERIVLVIGTGFKNGKPVFDGIIASGQDTGMGVWGYNSQVTKVTEAS
jgi:hypothetical protein